MKHWSEGRVTTHMKNIPNWSREAVRTRSLGRCERCGGRGSEWHHRRSRSVVEAHRHEPCNGLWLCHTCHRWAHDHPVWAMTEGLIVSRSHHAPGQVPVTTISGKVWLTCDGRYSDEPSSAAEPADEPQ